MNGDSHRFIGHVYWEKDRQQGHEQEGGHLVPNLYKPLYTYVIYFSTTKKSVKTLVELYNSKF